jgi:hypothetical protein
MSDIAHTQIDTDPRFAGFLTSLINGLGNKINSSNLPSQPSQAYDIGTSTAAQVNGPTNWIGLEKIK